MTHRLPFNKFIFNSDTETLCGIIKTQATEFNNVNVATALNKSLETP
jgi:hypothetical protein